MSDNEPSQSSWRNGAIAETQDSDFRLHQMLRYHAKLDGNNRFLTSEEESLINKASETIRAALQKELLKLNPERKQK